MAEVEVAEASASVERRRRRETLCTLRLGLEGM